MSGTQTYHSWSGPPKDHSSISSHPIEPYRTDQSSLDLQKSLNLNIASYLINTLESLYESTCHHRGGPIIQAIDDFFLNPNYQRSVENTWSIQEEMEQEMVVYLTL